MPNRPVSYPAVQMATQQIETKHQQIHDLQTRLQGQLADLQTRWRGSDAIAFQNGYRAFDTEFERIKASFDTIHLQLVQTLRECGAHEARQAPTTHSRASSSAGDDRPEPRREFS